MKEEKIKVLALLPMELPKEIELDNTLEAMQKFVGGLIECITLSDQNPNEKHHRHSAQNSRIKFYTQKSAKIGFLRSFCRSSPNFATDLLQTCYKRLKRGPPTRFIINLQK